MRPIILAALAALAAGAPALAQEYPRRLPSSGGETIIPSAVYQGGYDGYNYAPARRVGDTLYVSGVIIGRAEGEGNDAAAFEAQTRRAFAVLDATLRAAGATFDDVVMINSFHVWEGPNFPGSRLDQLRIINRVKAEYIDGPWPAWTAVGTTGLFEETGIAEIQLIAHVGED